MSRCFLPTLKVFILFFVVLIPLKNNPVHVAFFVTSDHVSVVNISEVDQTVNVFEDHLIHPQRSISLG